MNNWNVSEGGCCGMVRYGAEQQSDPDTMRCEIIWWAYELANHILKPILDIFKTSDLAYSSSSSSSPSPSSDDDAYGVLLCDNDDWIRSSRSAATRANSSHCGSGVLPANNFSSSKSHHCVKHTINSQSLIFDLRGRNFYEMGWRSARFCVNYPDIPIYRPIYNQLHLLPTHQQHYPNRWYSSTSPARERIKKIRISKIIKSVVNEAHTKKNKQKQNKTNKNTMKFNAFV